MRLVLLLHFKVWFLLLFVCQKVFANKQICISIDYVCLFGLSYTFFLTKWVGIKVINWCLPTTSAKICICAIITARIMHQSIIFMVGKNAWEKRFNTSAKQEQEHNFYLYFCTQWRQLVFHWKDFIPHSLLFQFVSLTIPLPCETMADTSSAIVLLSLVETYFIHGRSTIFVLLNTWFRITVLFLCCFKSRFPGSNPYERALRCKLTTMTSYRHLKKKINTSTLSCHVQQISKTVDIFTNDLVLCRKDVVVFSWITIQSTGRRIYEYSALGYLRSC